MFALGFYLASLNKINITNRDGMILFIIFILGAVVIGAGAMLSPAWNTKQPRIGMTAALALALVMGGAVFWASLFGWDTLVVDYLLFALVTSIFLFGTLSYGQKRAESRGEELSDADQGWTGPTDLLLFGFAALIFIIPAVLLPVPLDTDAQGFGYLALMARIGGDFRSLAPWHPDVTYLYSPGFSALTAYLSQQLNLGIHIIQLGIGAVLGTLCVWLSYDLGSEIRDKRLGRATAAAMLLGLGLFTAYMDSHFTTLLALTFSLGFLIYVYRYIRDGWLPDLIAAGLMLGSVVLAHPDTTIILGLGFVPWLLTMWLGEPRPTPRRWLGLLIGVPVVALMGIAPWLVTIRDLLGAEIVSPFTRDPGYALVMVLYHGVIIVPIALLGAVVGLRRRETMAILSVGWLILALDFSTTGILPTLLSGILAPVLRYDYPFSIAWHAPIIPYAILGGLALLWLWDRVFEPRFGRALHRVAPVALAAGCVALIAVALLSQPLLAFSKGRVSFFGAFSSADDVAAMEWLRTNTPEDARILNHPGPHEGDWVPVIAERNTVYFRPQPFFRGTETIEAEQEQLMAFWRDPANPDNAELLADAGIDYVIVPQIFTEPAALETMYRWRPPISDVVQMSSDPADAPYLDLVFDANGAQVYAFTGYNEDENGSEG